MYIHIYIIQYASFYYFYESHLYEIPTIKSIHYLCYSCTCYDLVCLFLRFYFFNLTFSLSFLLSRAHIFSSSLSVSLTYKHTRSLSLLIFFIGFDKLSLSIISLCHTVIRACDSYSFFFILNRLRFFSPVV